MEVGLLCCNFKRCQVPLTNKAWVTYCYHIFCNEHFSLCRAGRCPVCSSELIVMGDSVPVNLSPSIEEQSMSLLGLSPSNILQVGSKAMSFWKFQIFQDKLYLTSLVKNLRYRLAQSESCHKNEKEQLNNLIQQERMKSNTLQRDLKDYIKKIHKLEAKVDRKNRQLYSFHKQIEALKNNGNGNSKLNRNDRKDESKTRAKLSPYFTSQMQTLDLDCDDMYYNNSLQLRDVPRPTFSFHPNI